ncbi:MAG: alpha-N-acetylglucosaminidase [Mucilaginibacter sp.]|nr:alpha-N-acetylglucosaminidase [Mucilaginibacter sp.]
MKRGIVIILACFYSISQAKADEFYGVTQLVKRRIPWLASHVYFEKLGKNADARDAFTLQTQNNNLLIRATSPSSAAMAVNWYLKYFCHQSLSLQTTNLKPLKVLPSINGIIECNTPFKYRYSLNYCTISYTMSFYKWKQWSCVLDWLALNGVNLALAPVGCEKLWDLTMQDFNFTKHERESFIAGPAFSAWWLMGNLEGWGGPESEKMMQQQVLLQKNMLNRMKELGIQPVMQGFYGIVPNALKQKYPGAKIIDQGNWAGGFKRPAMLSPQDPLFQKMAASYYSHMGKLFGSGFHFFGGDPFHEGGVSKGVDLELAGTEVFKAMNKTYPEATWVLQGWGNNPSNKLISKLPVNKVLILDLMGEDHQNWVDRKGYNGNSWVLGSVNNFGENNGLYGKLDLLANLPFKVLKSDDGKTLTGIGEIPEGYHNNPVLYDLIYDAAWQHAPVEIARWIDNYAEYRYGQADQNIQSAWQVFLTTIYNSKMPPEQGAPESIFCARPSLSAEHARTWGTLNRSYDQAEFERGVKLFAKAAGKFKNSKTYQYDLVDLVRQVVSNRGQDTYQQMVKSFQSKNIQEFKKSSVYFISLIKTQDSLLSGHPDFSLNSWLNSAYNFGQTQADKRLAIRNAKTQISYWGPDNDKTDLHDYANKEWGGLLGSLYLKRWQVYITYLNEKLAGKDLQEPVFFEMEKKWANTSYELNKLSNTCDINKVINVLNQHPLKRKKNKL